jgi:hypothetical protein
MLEQLWWRMHVSQTTNMMCHQQGFLSLIIKKTEKSFLSHLQDAIVDSGNVFLLNARIQLETSSFLCGILDFQASPPVLPGKWGTQSFCETILLSR